MKNVHYLLLFYLVALYGQIEDAAHLAKDLADKIVARIHDDPPPLFREIMALRASPAEIDIFRKDEFLKTALYDCREQLATQVYRFKVVGSDLQDIAGQVSTDFVEKRFWPMHALNKESDYVCALAHIVGWFHKEFPKYDELEAIKTGRWARKNIVTTSPITQVSFSWDTERLGFLYNNRYYFRHAFSERELVEGLVEQHDFDALAVLKSQGASFKKDHALLCKLARTEKLKALKWLVEEQECSPMTPDQTGYPALWALDGTPEFAVVKEPLQKCGYSSPSWWYRPVAALQSLIWPLK